MNEPWFRTYWILGRYPIHWKGALAVALWLAVESVFGFLWLAIVDTGSVWTLPVMIAFAMIGFGGIAIFEWRTEKSYERE